MHFCRKFGGSLCLGVVRALVWHLQNVCAVCSVVSVCGACKVFPQHALIQNRRSPYETAGRGRFMETSVVITAAGVQRTAWNEWWWGRSSYVQGRPCSVDRWSVMDQEHAGRRSWLIPQTGGKFRVGNFNWPGACRLVPKCRCGVEQHCGNSSFQNVPHVGLRTSLRDTGLTFPLVIQGVLVVCFHHCWELFGVLELGDRYRTTGSSPYDSGHNAWILRRLRCNANLLPSFKCVSPVTSENWSNSTVPGAIPARGDVFTTHAMSTAVAHFIPLSLGGAQQRFPNCRVEQTMFSLDGGKDFLNINFKFLPGSIRHCVPAMTSSSSLSHLRITLGNPFPQHPWCVWRAKLSLRATSTFNTLLPATTTFVIIPPGPISPPRPNTTHIARVAWRATLLLRATTTFHIHLMYNHNVCNYPAPPHANTTHIVRVVC